MLEDVQQPLDRVAWNRLKKSLTTRDATALLTWHQGALFLKQSDSQQHGYIQCPQCRAPATAAHVLWVCGETNKHFKKLPDAWEMEITNGVNLEFWAGCFVDLSTAWTLKGPQSKRGGHGLFMICCL